MNAETKVIHSILADPQTGAISTPIYQTSTFVQSAPGVNQGYDYARTNNPTRKVLEDAIAELENGHAGFAFSSGLAAIDSVLKLLSYGDEIIAVEDIYGGAYRLFEQVYKKFGILVKYVDTTDPKNVANAITDRTKLIWIESPTNPTLKISDIEAIAEIASFNDVLLAVDNTFASPVLQKPLDLGADIVVHSATKYLAGHSDVLAGLVVVKTEELAQKIKFNQNSSGAVLGPWDCWLTIRGLQTLYLRVEKQCENAFAVAKFLKASGLVDVVYYPGLRDHKNHAVAAKQQNAFGAIVSFSFKDDRVATAEKFVCQTKLFKLAESLGGVKSLTCHPASMTHKTIPVEQRHQSGIKDSLVRLSCGIENKQDLINDIQQAFMAICQKDYTRAASLQAAH